VAAQFGGIGRLFLSAFRFGFRLHNDVSHAGRSGEVGATPPQSIVADRSLYAC
jgi:hypothetical protein